MKRKAELERVPRRGHTHHVGRTLEWFRKYGFMVARTEKRALIIRPGMPAGFARIGPSQDLFGVADLVAIPPAEYAGRRGTWYVQVCARTGGAGHRAKALAAVVDRIPVLARIEQSGNRFIIVNYQLARTIPKGKRKDGRLVWVRRVEEYVCGFPFEGSPRASFVDWTETDFAFVESLPKCEKPKSKPRSTTSLVPTATSETASTQS